MKKAQLLFCIVFSFFLLSLTSAEAQDAPVIRTIAVQGNGTSTAPADQASISIGIECTREDAHAAERENNRIAALIQSELQKAGIQKEKIATARYTFYPVYNNEKGKSNQISGYTVNNTVSVTTDELSKIGDIIAASIRSGANQINSISFSVKASEDLKKKALQAAVKDAQSKAQIIATALGKQIVNVVRVSETNVSLENRRLASYAFKSASADSAPVPIQPGEVSGNANVEVVFEIQ